MNVWNDYCSMLVVMRMRNWTIVALFGGLFLAPDLYAQDHFATRTTGHLTMGIAPLERPQITFGGYGEYFLRKDDGSKHVSPFVRGGFGVIGGDDNSDFFWSAQLGILLHHLGWVETNGKHHVEVAGGYMHRGWPWTLPPAHMHMGYRYQRPNGLNLYRIGLSYPEGVYFGAGFLIYKNDE